MRFLPGGDSRWSGEGLVAGGQWVAVSLSGSYWRLELFS